MSDPASQLLQSNLKQLRLPTIGAESAKLARGAAAADEGHQQVPLRLTEVEVAARAAKGPEARIHRASFPVRKDFDTFDFSAVPSVPKQKVLELSRGEWIDQRSNCGLVGRPGTGKTHPATALGPAACRQGRRVRFFTAAAPVNRPEEAQKQYRLDRFLGRLDRADSLSRDELGCLAFSRSGAELLFQVFAGRYERARLLITSNLASGDWGRVVQGERMTAALLDRLTHRCHVFEMDGEGYRSREPMKTKKSRKSE